MTLKQYQDEIDKWAKQFENPYWDPKDIHLRLSEEVGELAREINHLYGAKKKKAEEPKGDMGLEIADIIFTLVCLANSTGIDLDDKMRMVIDKKCYGRDNDRYKKKE